MVTSIGYCIAHVTLIRFTVIYPPALDFCGTFFLDFEFAANWPGQISAQSVYRKDATR